MSMPERRNPFSEGKKFVVYYRNAYHKQWATFDFLETINECKTVLKKSSYFKIFKLNEDGKYTTLTTKKRISDKIVAKLARQIVSSPYKDLLARNIREWREKVEKEEMEKKNAL